MGYDIVSLIPGFCEAFLGQSDFEEGGMALRDRINVPAMDYSVRSLEQVDLYLDALRSVKAEIPWQTYTNTVLATGSYVGEVLRRNSNSNWIWVNYADYAVRFPQLPAAGMVKEDLYSAAVLVGDGKTVLFPFNKIVRNLEEGPENSTHYFVEGFLSGT